MAEQDFQDATDFLTGVEKVVAQGVSILKSIFSVQAPATSVYTPTPYIPAEEAAAAAQPAAVSVDYSNYIMLGILGLIVYLSLKG